MTQFKDSTGRAWPVTMTVGDIQRVERLAKVNLARVGEPRPGTDNKHPLLTDLTLDEMLLADVLFALVKPQADRESISDEAFAALLDGPTMAGGMVALREVLIDFFRDRRPDIVAALVKNLELIKGQIARNVARAEALTLPPETPETSPTTDPASTPGSTASTSPELSASTPGASPSAS